MSGRIQQFYVSGLFKDKAMRIEFGESWTEREDALTAVRGTLTGGSALRALRQACRKLREVMQVAEDRYLEVHAGELESSPNLGT